jgi:hypothetical protein
VSLVRLPSSEGVELAEDFGMASQQSGHQNHQQQDHDAFDDDQGFHGQLILPQTTGMAPVDPKEKL